MQPGICFRRCDPVKGRRIGMKRKWIGGLIAGIFVVVGSVAHSQVYPNKPVMMLVAFAAGGATDVGARIVSSHTEKELGRPIVVLNKVGAGGQVGWTELSRQKPDGYYIGFIQLPFINAMILETERKTVFNIDSFTPIITQGSGPGVRVREARQPLQKPQRSDPGRPKASRGD